MLASEAMCGGEAQSGGKKGDRYMLVMSSGSNRDSDLVWKHRSDGWPD